MSNDKKRFYSVETILEMFDISKPTLARWVAEGRIPAPIKIGQKRLWLRGEIDRLIEEKMCERDGIPEKGDNIKDFGNQ